MSRLILLMGLLVMLVPVAGLSQDRPKVEVFGGFSYANVNIDDERRSVKGWHAMVVINSRYSWLEFVADASGHYGSADRGRTVTHVAMAGMRMSFDRGRLMGFVHTLYGVSFGHPPLIPLEDTLSRQPVWFTFVPLGGGLDIELHKRVALRVFQFDPIFHSQVPDYLQTYAPTIYGGTVQPRVSAGVVLRFGKI